jgi:Flp pilus assembly protein CpaB
MRPKPRRRRLHVGLALRRQPRLWWLLTIATAVAVGWVVSSIVAEAERSRAAWGTSVVVAVATRDIEAGDPITMGDVDLVERPLAVLPDDALDHLPESAVASTAIAAGEVLVTARLAAAGFTGLAATLPEGSRAVAIPVEVGLAPPLAAGDRVDVLVALAPDAAGNGPPGFVVAAGALVVSVDEGAVTVAVQAPVAPRIAVALGHGAVTLALVGPDG